ncbi:MAG: hypothetical protein CVV37_03590 [Nitrospira bacterium HGW-Nitrospira-1]|nr:MAG: hypothetical protein CVV37_03590 [Nitrospira bacterium HGW-Nitrospira-1]
MGRELTIKSPFDNARSFLQRDMSKIYVIGIGYKPLEQRAKEILVNSQVILASNRLFEVFKGYDDFESVKGKVKVINNVNETINFIKAIAEATPPNPPLAKWGNGGVVLLASGDPMFFGIGRRAVREFGKDNVEILPDLSSIQMAFSKIKEPWDDTFLVSLHGGPDPEKRRRLPYGIKDIPMLLDRHNKIAILTDKENNPAVIADFLNSSPLTHHSSLSLYVCERLGYHDERVTEGTPDEIAGMSFSEPNVVILKNKKPSSMSFPLVGNPSDLSESVKKDCGLILDKARTRAAMTDNFRFGLSETEIIHSRGLITKDEARAVTIHKLRLPQKGIFWDIGAGSGSVSIEAARLYPELKIFAIEKEEEQIENIYTNVNRFNAENIEVIKGEAPAVLEGLPAPDRVFIGGSGGRLKECIRIISNAMPSGIIVINAIAIDTLNNAIQALTDHGFTISISEISVSRSKAVAGRTHMSALNPVFIITGERESNDR